MMSDFYEATKAKQLLNIPELCELVFFASCLCEFELFDLVAQISNSDLERHMLAYHFYAKV